MSATTSASPESRGLRLPEAAAILGVSESTLRRDIRAGRIACYRLGPRTVRISSAEINRVMSGRSAL